MPYFIPERDSLDFQGPTNKSLRSEDRGVFNCLQEAGDKSVEFQERIKVNAAAWEKCFWKKTGSMLFFRARESLKSWRSLLSQWEASNKPIAMLPFWMQI